MDGHRKADIKVDKLLVNPENYRFDPVKDQQEAMLVMLRTQKDKILKLARDIAQRGLNPLKRLAVIEVDGGKYVSLEGNRRLTVLKLMSNPTELGGDYPFKGVFEDLHARYKDILPTVVECVVFSADQQDIADSWILLEHTGENQGVGTVPWNSVQKQRFELRHKQKLSSALQVLDLLRANGVDTSGILATNVERLLTTPQVRQALGLDFTNKQLVLFEPEADVIQKLKKVVERMKAKGFSVGDIYKVNDRLKWIQDVLGLQAAPATPQPATTPTPAPAAANGNAAAPSSQAAASPAPSSAAATPQPAAAGAVTSTLMPLQPAPTPAPAAPSVFYTLVNPTKVLPQFVPEKIRIIYRELQTVNVTGQRQAPHAVAALLRILIEITAQEYLMRKQGFQLDGSNVFRNPAEQGKAYDRLDEKLKYIANRCNLPGNVANVLRVLVADQLISTTLNQVMHNTIFRASSTTIKELWQNFERVFDHLIVEMQ